MEIYNIGSQFVPIIKEAVSQCGVPISAKCTAPLPSGFFQTAGGNPLPVKEGWSSFLIFFIQDVFLL